MEPISYQLPTYSALKKTVQLQRLQAGLPQVPFLGQMVFNYLEMPLNSALKFI